MVEWIRHTAAMPDPSLCTSRSFLPISYPSFWAPCFLSVSFFLFTLFMMTALGFSFRAFSGQSHVNSFRLSAEVPLIDLRNVFPLISLIKISRLFTFPIPPGTLVIQSLDNLDLFLGPPRLFFFFPLENRELFVEICFFWHGMCYFF